MFEKRVLRLLMGVVHAILDRRTFCTYLSKGFPIERSCGDGAKSRIRLDTMHLTQACYRKISL